MKGSGMKNNKLLHNAAIVLLYLLSAPVVLAAVKDTIHGSFDGVMAWDLFYNVLGGAGGGIIQVVRNLQNPRKYSKHISVELAFSMFVSAFAGLLTYLFVASSNAITVGGLMMLFFSCCSGVLGYEAIRAYTDNFKKTVAGEQREE